MESVPSWAFAPLPVVAFGAAAWLGRRQRREARGTLGRLLAVSAAVSGLACLPLLVTVALAALGRGGWATVPAGAGAAVVTFLLMHAWLLPPVRFARGREPLPLLDDPIVRARVEVLATTLGLAVPTTRVLRSAGALEVQAFAGGLVSPSLVVCDGVLHRLPPLERDAILAHELGHVATGSLWTLAAIVPLASGLTLLASPLLAPLAALGLWFLLIAGLRSALGRHVEVACDLAAARAVSHAAMAAAVHKIHAAHALPRSGLLPWLVHATTTHPSRETRRARLREAAPEAERPAIAVDATAARRDRAGALAAFAAGLAAVATLIAAGRAGEGGVSLAIGLVTASTPELLLHRALARKHAHAARQLGGHRLPSSRGLLVAGLLALVAGAALFFVPIAYLGRGAVPLAFRGWPWPGVSAFGVGTLVLAVEGLRQARANALRQEVVIAMLRHDWTGAVAVGRARPERLARDAVLRNNVALAAALAGDGPSALDELEALGAAPRPLPAAWLSLSLLAEWSDPARAVRAAERAAALLPDDPTSHAVLGRALRRAGRTDEAAAAVERGLALDPDVATLHATSAAIALDRGDLAAARAAVDRALELAPGDAHASCVRAELLLAARDPAAAEAVRDAVAVAAATPFAFLGPRVAALQERLARS